MSTSSDHSIRQVALVIDANKNEILTLFSMRLKERVELPEDIGESITHLIPQQIDSLIQLLAEYSSSQEAINSLAREHVKLRTGNKVFTSELLISEFLVLRDVIFEVLERKAPVDARASNIIWQFIVYSIRVAVAEFENVRITESEKVLSDLGESESVNREISMQIEKSRESEERYRTLVEGVEDYAVFTIDTTGVITSWNPGAERMKGYNFKEAIGHHFSMLYPDEGKKKNEPMHHLHVALIEGRYRGEGLRRRKNGELFLADVYIRPIFQDGKHLGFAKIVSDLTERNKLMQEANISNSVIVDLKSEKEQRSNFVLTLSHDLRGPLSVARAAVELVGKNLESPAKARRYIEKSLRSIDRVNRMIGDLLDANRIMGGKMPALKLQRWDLVRKVENVCDDFRTLGAEIVLQAPESELLGEWDAEGIRRVLENLLSNALKYGDSSRPVTVSVLDLGKSASVKIHNLGEVIKENDQKSLFDQFRRTSSSDKKIKGWGIGLSLVKGITEAHGGSVEIESYPTEGTTFTVNLPKRGGESLAKAI